MRRAFGVLLGLALLSGCQERPPKVPGETDVHVESVAIEPAPGASLELETTWWLVPLSFELQGTRRLSLDEEYAIYFVIGGGDR